MPARKKKPGQKHVLLLYRHAINRLWRITFLLSLVMWFAYGAWKVLNWLNYEQYMRALHPPRDKYVLWIAMFTLAMVFFMLIVRNMAYVRVLPRYLQIGAPFFSLRIGYGRIRGVKQDKIGPLFSARRQSWGDKNFLQPYRSQAALIVLTRGMPMAPFIIRLFLPKHVLHPTETGFVFLVKDWMGLSAEIESALGTHRTSKIDRPRGGLRGLYEE